MPLCGLPSNARLEAMFSATGPDSSPGCFASALNDLGLPTGSLVLSLFGFNVGVELGQLAIVALFLPVAFALRGTWAYRRAVLTGGSVAVAAIASVWLIQRAFNLSVPGLSFAG